MYYFTCHTPLWWEKIALKLIKNHMLFTLCKTVAVSQEKKERHIMALSTVWIVTSKDQEEPLHLYCQSAALSVQS